VHGSGSVVAGVAIASRKLLVRFALWGTSVGLVAVTLGVAPGAASAAELPGSAGIPPAPQPPATVLKPPAAAAAKIGDHRATPLTPSATWSAGKSTGSFTWSYPLAAPKPPAGPAPELRIGYDSGSVDGRLTSMIDQPSWVGEGFDLPTSYIERSFASCRDDGQTTKYDLCWKNDNVRLVLNGQATELVKAPDGTWRLKNDDGSRVKRLTGASNGAHDGEHWEVVSPDGLRRVFGLEALPEAPAGKRTSSAWTVPVFGDDTGEPCHAATFAASSCDQAWRWNLDYVVDLHGNASTYWYAKELNNYARNGDPRATRYVRGGYLSRIDYGQRADALFSAPAPYSVTFTTAERCVASGTGCAALTAKTRNNWPDVPFGLICADGAKCGVKNPPSFFSRKRLVGVSTRVLDTAPATPAYRTVDTWALKHSFLDPGEVKDATDQSLWLTSLQRTTAAAGTTALPPIRFAARWLVNRVDSAADKIRPLSRPRISAVTSETGAVTTVSYSAQDCLAGKKMPVPDSNTRRCFPSYWYPNGQAAPRLDWFHKYVVTGVDVADKTGGAPSMPTAYAYSGGGAWHYADHPVTPASRRTWSQWRGYDRVTAVEGRTTDGPRSKRVDVYFRGMDGDRKANGTRKVVVVKGVNAPAVADSDQYAGLHRESVVYNGETTAQVSGSISTPWSRLSASHTTAGYTTSAHVVRTGKTQDRTTVTSGPSPVVRTRTVTTTYDGDGLPTAVDDAGDDAKTGDERCTRSWYARNLDKNLLSPVSRTQVLGVRCSSADSAVLPASSATPGDVISDRATAYDTTTWSADQTPTLGDPRWTGRASGYSSGNPSWQTLSTATFDALGRPTTSTDANGTTTTEYVPAGAGATTQTKVTNPAGHVTTTTVDISRGSPVKISDPNGKLTELSYDALGRLTQVWLPTNLKVVNAPPNRTFAYSVSATAPSWTSTSSRRGMGSLYNTTYTIVDSLLRPRQVQAPSPLTGRVIAATFHNSRGLVAATYADIYDSAAAPSGKLMKTVNGQAPRETVTTFDGVGRPLTSTFKAYGTAKWSTTSTYTGDSVATSAPAGGSAVREFTDALGRLVERREYASTSPTVSTFARIVFAYDSRGRLARTTGPDQAVWSYSYDLFGRQVQSVDPDKGTTQTGYTELDQIDWTVDAAGNKLLYAYDNLGRKVGLWETARTDDAKLAAWTFDSLAKGQPDAATRYVGGVTGSAYVKKTTKYDNAYRPKTQQVVLPSSDPLVVAGTPSTFTYTFGYNGDGTLQYGTEPAVAGLPQEFPSWEYNTLGMPIEVTGKSGIVRATSYSPLGDVQQVTLGTGNPPQAKQAFITNTFEAGTRRLIRSNVTDSTNPWMVQDLHITYDPAGNVRSVFDPATLKGAGKADNQCFTYDGYQRLVEAWTPKAASCATKDRTVAKLGGAAPYWSSFAYTVSGLRSRHTQHAAAGDTTVSYGYGADLAARPHALTSTSTTAPGRSPVAETYGYDGAGNTTSRPGVAATQTLAWDSEGRLKTVSEPAAGATPARSTSYLYDADGELLIRRPTSGDGVTVLYLGNTEVTMTQAGATTTLTGTRYYDYLGSRVAVRTGTKGSATTTLTWLANDWQGTASVALNSTTQAVTKRYTGPFGAPRGAQPAWVGDKRWLGGTADGQTGLTWIADRQYDPNIGRFISVDPVLDTADSQSLNGYTVPRNNPAPDADWTSRHVGSHIGRDPSCQAGLVADDRQRLLLRGTGNVAFAGSDFASVGSRGSAWCRA